MTPALSLKTERQKSCLALADQLLRALEDRVLDQVLVGAGAELLAGLIPDFDLDGALERLVDAVLAPGLGEGLEFDVGRLAAGRAEVVLDRLHLGQREEQVLLAGEGFELVIGEVAQGDVGELEGVGVALRELGREEGVEVDRLDDAVGEDAGGDPLEDGFVELAFGYPGCASIWGA